MHEFMGIREGVLVLPTGKKVPLNIDCVRYSPGEIPDISVSIVSGHRGHLMVESYDHMVRGRKPFLLSPPTNATIKKVIFNNPATIVIWSDGTKTVVKCQYGDTYSKELGLAMCISKKYFGNKGNFNEEFKKWIPEDEKKEIVIATDGYGNEIKRVDVDSTCQNEAILIEEMRKILKIYCDNRFFCRTCELGGSDCRCGTGVLFTTKHDGNYDMSDDEIREAYNKVFRKRED